MFLKHWIGEFFNGQQRCVHCNRAVVDYTVVTMVPDGHDPFPHPWPIGVVYTSGSLTTMVMPDGEYAALCTPHDVPEAS